MSPRQQHVADTEEATPCLTSDTNVYSVIWVVIPQQPYKSYGPTTRTLVTGAFPSIKVGVAVRDALVPEVLAKVLLDPLHSAFDSPVRKRTSKLTIRFVFHILGRKPVVNGHPTQIAEYMAGAQSSLAVQAAWEQNKTELAERCRGAVPLMRAALVEKVAGTLRSFLERLKLKNTPLVFHGHEVECAHLRIVDIFRPTDATVQPTLEILPEFYGFYRAEVHDCA